MRETQKASSKQKRLVSPDRVSAFPKGISYSLRLVNAKSLTDRLSCIATVATFVIACIDIFSQPVALQKFRPSALTAKNKVDSELIDSESTTKVPRIWDKRFVVYPPERPLEFQINVQDEFFRRASILQIDFLRRAFEQSFASFAAGVVGDLQFNGCAARQGLALSVCALRKNSQCSAQKAASVHCSEHDDSQISIPGHNFGETMVNPVK